MCDIDPQIIADRNEAFKLKKLNAYLQRDLPDPLAELDLLASRKDKKRKIKLVAQAVQHYSVPEPPPTPENQKPKLCSVLPNDGWQKLTRYSICLYGQQEIMQTGDFVKTYNHEHGIIDYFFSSEATTMVSLTLCKKPKDWQTLLSPAHIRTNSHISVALGMILFSKTKGTFEISPFIYDNQCLRLLPLAPSRSLATEQVLLKSYLLCDKKLLHCHPLVISAARFVSLLFTPHFLADMINKKFTDLMISIVNDEEDSQALDFTEFTMLHRMCVSEDSCSICRQLTRIACAENETLKTCEPCFVALRKVCRIFLRLEKLRAKTKGNLEIPRFKISEQFRLLLSEVTLAGL